MILCHINQNSNNHSCRNHVHLALLLPLLPWQRSSVTCPSGNGVRCQGIEHWKALGMNMMWHYGEHYAPISTQDDNYRQHKPSNMNRGRNVKYKSMWRMCYVNHCEEITCKVMWRVCYVNHCEEIRWNVTWRACYLNLLLETRCNTRSKACYVNHFEEIRWNISGVSCHAVTPLKQK